MLDLYNISKRETSIIKSVAISLIVLHNFLHWTNPIGENEMSFSSETFIRLMSFIEEKPWRFFDAYFSYFGHYGVELFIFCSGYGLSKQYIKNKPISYRTYIIPKLLKLYTLLLLGLVFCYVFFLENGILWYLKFSALSLSMLKTFSFDYLFYGVGPWWYFSLAIQLYLLFPAVFWIIQKYQMKGFSFLLLASYILMFSLASFAESIKFPIYGNCIGHIPEFALGVALATTPNLQLNWKIILGSTLLFALSCFYKVAFPFSFLSITIILVYVIKVIIPRLSMWLSKWLFFIGEISMIVFVMNGPFRSLTFDLFFNKLHISFLPASVIHYIIVIGCSYPLYLIYKKLIDVLGTIIINNKV